MPRNFDYAHLFSNKEPLDERKLIFSRYAGRYKSLLYRRTNEQFTFPHPIYKQEYDNEDFLIADGIYVGDSVY